MSILALTYIVFSALMHALWNMQVKQSHDKTIFIWWMFIASSLLLNVVLLFMPQSFPPPDLHTLLLALAGAICFVFYHLFNGVAYRQGDLSLTYPLAQTSMIYVPLWGMLFLHEQLTAYGGIGILCVVAGAYCVQLPSFSARMLLRPLRNLRHGSVRAALAAGFIYSIGSIVDKTGVTGYSPFYFTYLLVMMMVVVMTLNLCRQRYRGRILQEWQNNRRLILYSGPVMLGSFISFRYGLSLAPVSYAVPVRQVNVLFGVLIGILFLGEPCGRVRIVAALMILIGVLFIRVGG
ncbi:MAG: EamA family transporter [Desulfuromonas sp.]|nr:EamA family transporter [Desulfuromonas sp.]